LFCFVLNQHRSRPNKTYAGQKKSQILSSWTKPPFEAPQSLLSPNPPYARKKKQTLNRPPTFASGALMASSSLHYFVLSKEKRSKEILEWCLDGILLIPLANIRIFQEIQHRACQSFILEKIHHLDSGPTLPPALPTFPPLSRDPLNPLF
jgi:hypothetical protein